MGAEKIVPKAPGNRAQTDDAKKTLSGIALKTSYSRQDVASLPPLAPPGSFPYKRGIHRTDVSGTPLDHAAVFGFRNAGGNQSALSVFALAWPRWPFCGIRSADVDGLRRGCTGSARRSRQMRRLHLLA